MSLYTRHRVNLGSQRAKSEMNKGLADILISSPLSFHYQAPVKSEDTKMLYQYFTYIQTRRYGKVLDLPAVAIRKHFKILLRDHSVAWICRSIKYASWVSEYPFSPHFAERMLLGYESQFGKFEHRRDQAESKPTSTVETLRPESSAQLELFVA